MKTIDHNSDQSVGLQHNETILFFRVYYGQMGKLTYIQHSANIQNTRETQQ